MVNKVERFIKICLCKKKVNVHRTYVIEEENYSYSNLFFKTILSL